jgi:hypothetical protein
LKTIKTMEQATLQAIESMFIWSKTDQALLKHYMKLRSLNLISEERLISVHERIRSGYNKVETVIGLN